MSTREIKIAVLYPSDPAGDNIGGIESFVRGLLLAAPEHVHYTIFGATTDTEKRPVGELTRCSYQGKEFDYFPLYVLSSNQSRSFIPTTVTYLLSFCLRRPNLRKFDVVECHRIEQLFLLGSFDGIANLFLHNATAEVLGNNSSDMRWKWIPSAYHRIESRGFERVDNVLVVTEEGAQYYRERYIEKADRIGHIATVVNTQLFYLLGDDDKSIKASRLKERLNIPPENRLIVFVGRLDSSKNPKLLLHSFLKLREDPGFKYSLLMVGEGVLGAELKKIVLEGGHDESAVKFLGFQRPEQVAELMQASDLFALSSAYEGMPISVLEALSCGLPILTTNVGAVDKVVQSEQTGVIVEENTEEHYVNGLTDITSSLANYDRQVCSEMAAPYAPAKVFAKVFTQYEALMRKEKAAN